MRFIAPSSSCCTHSVLCSGVVGQPTSITGSLTMEAHGGKAEIAFNPRWMRRKMMQLRKSRRRIMYCAQQNEAGRVCLLGSLPRAVRPRGPRRRRPRKTQMSRLFFRCRRHITSELQSAIETTKPQSTQWCFFCIHNSYRFAPICLYNKWKNVLCFGWPKVFQTRIKSKHYSKKTEYVRSQHTSNQKKEQRINGRMCRCGSGMC